MGAPHVLKATRRFLRCCGDAFPRYCSSLFLLSASWFHNIVDRFLFLRRKRRVAQRLTFIRADSHNLATLISRQSCLACSGQWMGWMDDLCADTPTRTLPLFVSAGKKQSAV